LAKIIKNSLQFTVYGFQFSVPGIYSLIGFQWRRTLLRYIFIELLKEKVSNSSTSFTQRRKEIKAQRNPYLRGSLAALRENSTGVMPLLKRQATSCKPQRIVFNSKYSSGHHVPN